MRAYLSAAFTFGARADNDPSRSRGERYGITQNPVGLVPAQAQYERALTRLLSESELRLVWDAPEGASPLIADVIKLALLTGARPGELRRLRWTDYQDGDLTIPEEVSKNHRALALPSGETAQGVVEALRSHTGDQEWMFASRRAATWTGGAITSTVLARSVRGFAEAAGISAFTPRDLRRRT